MVSSELAERIELPPPEVQATLWGTTDPLVVVQAAQRVAQALGDVLKQQHLTMRIGGGRQPHVLVEGWTLLGSMLGVFAEVEISEPMDGYPGAWQAHAVARTLAGDPVGAADGMCSPEERTWRGRDAYAIRSMAQTRAISKALRMPLGFVVVLAGYSATPAEELGPDAARGASQPRAPRTASELRDAIEEVAMARGIDRAQLTELAQQAGVQGRATVPQLRTILAALRALEPAPASSPNEEAPDEQYPG